MDAENMSKNRRILLKRVENEGALGGLLFACCVTIPLMNLSPSLRAWV
jgi:uncharacterized protein involved in cysteine biosynthesis